MLGDNGRNIGNPNDFSEMSVGMPKVARAVPGSRGKRVIEEDVRVPTTMDDMEAITSGLGECSGGAPSGFAAYVAGQPDSSQQDYHPSMRSENEPDTLGSEKGDTKPILYGQYSHHQINQVLKAAGVDMQVPPGSYTKAELEKLLRGEMLDYKAPQEQAPIGSNKEKIKRLVAQGFTVEEALDMIEVPSTTHRDGFGMGDELTDSDRMDETTQKINTLGEMKCKEGQIKSRADWRRERRTRNSTL